MNGSLTSHRRIERLGRSRTPRHAILPSAGQRASLVGCEPPRDQRGEWSSSATNAGHRPGVRSRAGPSGGFSSARARARPSRRAARRSAVASRIELAVSSRRAVARFALASSCRASLRSSVRVPRVAPSFQRHDARADGRATTAEPPRARRDRSRARPSATTSRAAPPIVDPRARRARDWLDVSARDPRRGAAASPSFAERRPGAHRGGLIGRDQIDERPDIPLPGGEARLRELRGQVEVGTARHSRTASHG